MVDPLSCCSNKNTVRILSGMAVSTALLVLLLIARVDCGSTVTFLPGFHGPLPFHLQTGYVGVGESEDVQLFYYFVESERNPNKDPLLLWLTGGPACSAWSGLVYEIGPLNYRLQAYNGSLPTLILNDYSWTKVSSIIFVDSPVGTGFSYGKTPSASKAGDKKQVRELAQFFNKWLIDHPEFVSNPVYIAGDSYSGKIIPVLLQQLSKEIEEGVFVPINLQGYIIGNPVTFPHEKNYRIQFAHGMALISDELYESLERSCRGKYFEDVDPNNTECLNNIEAYEETISGIPTGNILDAKCDFDTLKSHDLSTTRKRRWLNQNPQRPIDCREFDHLLSGYWANDPEVRRALHIRKGSKKIWLRCNWDIRDNLYGYEISSTIEYHANLSAKGFRSLIYSGDHDYVVPFMSTQAWIRSLNYSIVDEWRPWVVQGQVAGFTRTYSNRMTFATVKGGGHTAPQYKPKECFTVFKRWVDYQSL